MTLSESSWAGRPVLPWLAAAVTGLAVVAIRVAVDSSAALHEGERAEREGRVSAALAHHLDAARLYLPGSPWSSRAVGRLDAIAQQAQAGGDRDLARRALESLRAGCLAARSFYTPHAALLPGVEQRLARLLAESEEPAVAPGAALEARVAWHVTQLARHPGPRVTFVVLALGGLVTWIGAAVTFWTRALDATLRLKRRPAAVAGVLFLVGFTLFLAGLRLA